MRENLKDKKRIVIKIGSSSLLHEKTQKLDLLKIEKLVRILTDLKNSGKDVVLVSSGAIAVGTDTVGLDKKPDSLPLKQACAAVGQAKLMMVYQKIFAEYGSVAAQVLLTKSTVTIDNGWENAKNTFLELLKLGTIPVVNENDTVSTYEIEQVNTFGDNDRLSAIVAAIIDADLLILLSDIDGLYTDDPKSNPDARFIEEVKDLSEVMACGKHSSGSNVGTGGMAAKLVAAEISNAGGADMVITNADNLDNIIAVIKGENVGTYFASRQRSDSVDIIKMLKD